MTELKKNRIDYIDQLKGFTILLVIIGHLSYFCWQDTNSLILKWLASFQMPLFIFLSGLMASRSMSEPSLKFLVKKIVTLLFPFIFVGSIYSLFIRGEALSLWTSGTMHLGYWFTWVLFWIFIIYRIFQKLYLRIFKTENLLKESLYWCTIILLFQIIRKISIIPESITVFFSIGQLASCLQYFIGGVLITKYTHLRELIFSTYGFSIAFISYWILFFFIEYSLFSNFVGYLILGICGIIIMVYYFEKHEQSLLGGNLLIKLGRRSLDIYVLHYFLLGQLPLKQYSSIVLGNGLLFELLISIILALIIAFCSLIMSSMIRTSPFLGCLFLGDWSFIKNRYLEEKLFPKSDLNTNNTTLESVVKQG